MQISEHTVVSAKVQPGDVISLSLLYVSLFYLLVLLLKYIVYNCLCTNVHRSQTQEAQLKLAEVSLLLGEVSLESGMSPLCCIA